MAEITVHWDEQEPSDVFIRKANEYGDVVVDRPEPDNKKLYLDWHGIIFKENGAGFWHAYKQDDFKGLPWNEFAKTYKIKSYRIIGLKEDH